MGDLLRLHFKKPGLKTSIQDFGRTGFQHLGIPIGGALDKEAMIAANRVLNNPDSNPVLECTLIGPEIEFTGAGNICLTGAEMNAELNNELVARYKTLKVKTGDVLKLKGVDEGCRSYLGIQGKWNVANWLGSYSALSSYLSENGFMASIQRGDELEVENIKVNEDFRAPTYKKPYYSSCYIVRVVTGPEFSRFSIEQIEDFFNKIFSVSQDANRMGYRLNETIQGYQALQEEISSGIIPGTIQITNSGQPIVLLADAQTTGGYPRIANIISEDLDIFGQMKPGDDVKFMLASL